MLSLATLGIIEGAGSFVDDEDCGQLRDPVLWLRYGPGLSSGV